MYFVYVLITKSKNQKYISYVGYTNNIQKRLLLHNTSKGAKFTRGRKWILIYKKKYKSKTEALKNEYKIKNDKKNRDLIKQKYLLKLK